MTPRNVRNNNPGNLEAASDWDGLMPATQMTPAQKLEARFAVFLAPKWGFHALVKTLMTYEEIHGLNTVAGIIARFAPSPENNIKAYIQDVCSDMNVARDQVLVYPDCLSPLSKAITKHETGSWTPWWHDQDLADGLAFAGL